MEGEKFKGEQTGYSEEANPWEELEQYGKEYDSRRAITEKLGSTPGVARGATFTEMAIQEAISRRNKGGKPEETNGSRGKYQEAVKAAKKALISGGILPAFLSVQALGLMNGGAEFLAEQGREIITELEKDAEKFVLKHTKGEEVKEPDLVFGENLFSFEDDNLDFDDYADSIFYGEDGHVVPREMIYGKVADYDGTMEERAEGILSDMSTEELKGYVERKYAGLVAELDVIGEEINASELDAEGIAKALTGYLIGHCRYSGDVDDPRGRWGNNAEGKSNWETVLLESIGPENPDTKTSDLGADFICKGRGILAEEFGLGASMAVEAYDALVGGESNCFGMANAVTFGANYLNSLNHPDEDEPVAYTVSLSIGENGKHAGVLYKGAEGKWKFLDPTFEVGDTSTTLEVLAACGVEDFADLGSLIYRTDSFQEPAALSKYCNQYNAECIYAFTGENSNWHLDLSELGALYEEEEESEVVIESPTDWV